jgi:hypothetical protein
MNSVVTRSPLRLLAASAGLVAAAAVAPAAFAQEATVFAPIAATSTADASTVRAAAAAAVAAGQIDRGEGPSAWVATATGEPAERAQVRAEAREAARQGLLREGEATLVVTPSQSEAMRLAGQRAASQEPAKG